jgi:hypothetical protein
MTIDSLLWLLRLWLFNPYSLSLILVTWIILKNELRRNAGDNQRMDLKYRAYNLCLFYALGTILVPLTYYNQWGDYLWLCRTLDALLLARGFALLWEWRHLPTVDYSAVRIWGTGIYAFVLLFGGGFVVIA